MLGFTLLIQSRVICTLLLTLRVTLIEAWQISKNTNSRLVAPIHLMNEKFCHWGSISSSKQIYSSTGNSFRAYRRSIHMYSRTSTQVHRQAQDKAFYTNMVTDTDTDVNTSSIGSDEHSSASRIQRKSRRTPPNKRYAIRWVVESIQKLYDQTSHNKDNDDDISASSASLSVSNDNDWQLLSSALTLLYTAKTDKDVLDAGRVIDSLDLTKFSFDIQERVLKATAMSGLITLSIKLLYSMIQPNLNSSSTNVNYSDTIYIPSPMSYTALLNSLRKLRKTNQMRQVLQDLASACRQASPQQSLNVVAFNIFLATLSDATISEYDESSPILTTTTTSLQYNTFLQEAFDLLRPGNAIKIYSISNNNGPDTFSFNTVLNTAASIGDLDMVQDILNLMKDQNITHDVYTYNARLKAANFLSNVQMCLSYKLEIIDDLLLYSRIQPDQYTIESVLVPLASEGRMKDIVQLLCDFVNDESKSNHTISNAFEAFLISLVKGGEVDIARFIFDVFILSSYDIDNSTSYRCSTFDHDAFLSDDKITTLMDISLDEKSLKKCASKLKPTIRHFNALLDGYRDYYERSQTSSSRPNSTQEDKSTTMFPFASRLTEEVTKLLEIMHYFKIQPDEYTVTILMGLQISSEGITALYKDVTSKYGIKMTPPVYHAIITAYGRVDDPSSACVMFHHMLLETKMVYSLNSWNVILSVLSKASMKHDKGDRINCKTAIASNLIQKDDNSSSGRVLITMKNEMFSFIEMVHSRTFFEALQAIFDIMSTNSNITIAIQKCDSNDNGNSEIWNEKQSNKRILMRPNAQSYCLLASAMARNMHNTNKQPLDLFRSAVENGIPADGRFINAIIRCYEDRIDDALTAWKAELRKAVWSYENERSNTAENSLRIGISSGSDINSNSISGMANSNNKRKKKQRGRRRQRADGKNLLAAYHGLIYVSGRAGRPDIALRLCYAMNKEKIEPSETTLNCYHSGKRHRDDNNNNMVKSKNSDISTTNNMNNNIRLMDQYELLLSIECTKYDKYDKRKASEKRVRIIV